MSLCVAVPDVLCPAVRAGGVTVTHPAPGDVYWVASRAYKVIGKKEGRPVVVMSEVAGANEWYVWPRTTKKDRPGIDHGRNLSIGMDKDGRFCGHDITRLAGHVFQDPELATFRGTIEPETFKKLMDWWLA